MASRLVDLLQPQRQGTEESALADTLKGFTGGFISGREERRSRQKESQQAQKTFLDTYINLRTKGFDPETAQTQARQVSGFSGQFGGAGFEKSLTEEKEAKRAKAQREATLDEAKLATEQAKARKTQLEIEELEPTKEVEESQSQVAQKVIRDIKGTGLFNIKEKFNTFDELQGLLLERGVTDFKEPIVQNFIKQSKPIITNRRGQRAYVISTDSQGNPLELEPIT